MAKLKKNIVSLNGMIFTDGQVLTFDPQDQKLVMRFVDYQDNLLEILFVGIMEFTDHNVVHSIISDSAINIFGEKTILQLFDDEKSCLFEVIFKECEINLVIE